MAGPRTCRAVVLGAALVCFAVSQAQTQPAAKPAAPASRAKDWAAIAQLPDWGGVWRPNIRDQVAQEKDMPWNAVVASQIAQMQKEEAEGRPRFILYGCLPPGSPSWMLMSHEAMELLFTPGRVTILGDGDGNRLRRIYTDGRGHPEDPDPTFFGHSIGHWEGQALVIDTTAILPQVQLAVSESVGIPNNGDMHVRERIYLAKPGELRDDLEITAPKVLSRPYRTTRIWTKQTIPPDLTEAVCQQGMMRPSKDEHGNDVFKVQKMNELGQPVADDK